MGCRSLFLLKEIKTNFKFRMIPEKSEINQQKLYICELIMFYILKLIINFYINSNEKAKNKMNNGFNVNNKHLFKSIYDHLLYYIIYGQLRNNILIKFCDKHIKYYKNKKDRSFPRESKMPFTKWYIKKYSDQTKYMKIINAIIKGNVNKLNKNLKTCASKIILINDKKYP